MTCEKMLCPVFTDHPFHFRLGAWSDYISEFKSIKAFFSLNYLQTIQLLRFNFQTTGQQ